MGVDTWGMGDGSTHDLYCYIIFIYSYLIHYTNNRKKKNNYFFYKTPSPVKIPVYASDFQTR